MEYVSLDELEPARLADGTVRRRLSDPLGTTRVAINHYAIPPGAGFPGGLHAHMDQEEVFVVLAGVATFETMAGEIAVGGGEAVRFAPGEFQSGRNDSAEELIALALGAPGGTADIRIPVACHACGFDPVRLATDDAVTFVCPDCGTEGVPSGCPDCGHEDLRVTLGDGTDPIIACQDCGATFDDPPLRG